MSKGSITVLSGPSGSGKNTVYDGLRAMDPDFVQTVSATTRKPRNGEREGVDYYFVSPEEFKKLIDNGEFVEYVCYGGNYYGTLKKEIRRLVEMDKKVILVIEVNGAFNIKNAFPEAKTVFLLPPSDEELRRRIIKRGENTEEEIERRLQIAQDEMKLKDRYDYRVVNADLDECINNVYNIIIK